MTKRKRKRKRKRKKREKRNKKNPTIFFAQFPLILQSFTVQDLKEIARLWGLKFRDGGGISGKIDF